MGLIRRGAWLAVLSGAFLWPPASRDASAQHFFSSPRFELSDAVSLDETDSTARTHLERVKACLADEQWDEAVETLRQVMSQYGDKVIGIGDRRYISVRDYCHLRIAALPAPALELYRNRVDPQARRWYEQAIAERDRQLLLNILREMFCSSSGDDALLALGELALEQGEYPEARDYWEKLIETPPTRVGGALFEQVRSGDGLPETDAALLDRWYRAGDIGDPPSYELQSEGPVPHDDALALVRLWGRHGWLPQRLSYPQTDLDPAAIRARLVLVSILEGSPQRARGELEAFTALHPEAAGKLAGRSGSYRESLASLLEQSGDWPADKPDETWLTFAAGTDRNAAVGHRFELGDLVWQADLERQQVSDSRSPSVYGYRPSRVAEDNEGLLSYHPVVYGDLVLVNSTDRIHVFNLHTGEPAWGGSIDTSDPTAPSDRTRHSAILGSPRFTMTVHGGRLYARMGSPLTGSVLDMQFPSRSGPLVCYDLSAEGKQLWQKFPDKIGQTPPGDDRWAFEGSPVCDGRNVYVAMRRSDIRPQAHVACLDAETGSLLWRRFVCAAESPSRGAVDEITHNLLTLHRDTIYYNTNLGAVAALSTHDGAIRWLSLYPRAKDGDLTRMPAHFYRDLNPCLYDRGRLFVAPSDSSDKELIFALNAQTGEFLWSTSPGSPADVVHLLGVGGGRLLASGDKLWWIDVDSGKLFHYWPDGAQPKGFGRGLLAGDEVIWPTRSEIYRFDQATAARKGIFRLTERGEDLTGGNLLLTDQYVLVATPDKLHVFSHYSLGRKPQTGGAQAAASEPAEEP